MSEIFNKIIQWLAAKQIALAYQKGYYKANAEYWHDRERWANTEVNVYLLNKPVISHPNEWEDPIIGVCVDSFYPKQASKPIPIIRDYLTGETAPCYNTVRVVSWQKLKPYLYLDPFERWLLLSDQFSDDAYVKEKLDENVLTGIELENVLEETGFLKLLKDHPSYEQKEA